MHTRATGEMFTDRETQVLANGQSRVPSQAFVEVIGQTVICTLHYESRCIPSVAEM